MKSLVVAVAGASSGVGREAALAFARKGAAVVLIARRKGALEHVAAKCRRGAAAVLVRTADEADPAAMKAIASDVHRRFGRIDAWVNAASINMLAAERFPDTSWRRRVERRLFGTYQGVHAVVPYLRSQGSGVIVNVPSVLSRPGPPMHLAYLAAKDAMRSITYCLRRELADIEGVRVSAVVPGPVEPPESLREGEESPFAPLVPLIDTRRGAHAVMTCTRAEDGCEVFVDAAPQPLKAMLRAVPHAWDRIATVGRRDHIAETLSTTAEFPIIAQGEKPPPASG
ncbi:hypothetical protein GCM10028833_09960 [Glycomyces tarimensis]